MVTFIENCNYPNIILIGTDQGYPLKYYLSIYNINIIINDVIMKVLMKYYQLDYVMSFQKENFDIIKKILIRLGMLQNSYQSSE